MALSSRVGDASEAPAGTHAADRPDDAARDHAHDAALVERTLRGDADAYGELVARHMRRAFAIAFRILQHREDAEDTVQDAFIRALERIDALDTSRPFGPWLYRIVLNKALNSRRARSVRTTDEIPADAVSMTTSPATDADRSALRHRLSTALATLSEKQRTIVQLADIEEFTSGEIADMLGIADGTVRWHLHQARRTLRLLLDPDPGTT